MAEGIKNILLNCSQESNPATQSKLEEILYKINELDFQSFANVKRSHRRRSCRKNSKKQKRKKSSGTKVKLFF